ncbi:MAG TPA: bifunctional 4-hydroxy-2-oxoglutarate aldolase/2-dehydro-3-deoxy-phosphogluconate aldolase [Candidatus Limnocylindrales bacterium]
MTRSTTPEALRDSSVADAIRSVRLIAVLRKVAPRERLLDLVAELAAAGVRVFEVTMDTDDAADDLEACRRALQTGGVGRCFVGGGTVRTVEHLHAARRARADFAVAPVLDPAILAAALDLGLPFVPGAYTPTEADRAWRSGATFVKLFPGSSLGPAHVRELRGPLPEIETIVTGGVDATNAVAFLEAGAIAVGIGSALLRASPAERLAIVAATAAGDAPRPGSRR